VDSVAEQEAAAKDRAADSVADRVQVADNSDSSINKTAPQKAGHTLDKETIP